MMAGECMVRALRSADDRTLIYCDEGQWSGAAIAEAVDSLASELQSILGVNRGATVGMWFWNSIDFVIALLAIQRAGFCALPADASASTLEAKQIFTAAGSVLVLVGREHDLPGTGVDRRYSHEDRQGTSHAFQPVELDESVPAITLPRYVSDGALVGVTLTFGDWRRRLRFNMSLHEGPLYGPVTDGKSPCFLTVQQMSHGTARIGTLPFLLLGIPQVIMHRFDASAVVECILRHAVTTTFMVPGMVERLTSELGSRRQNLSLSRLLYGGAKINNDAILTSYEILGPCLIRLYGSIEAGWPMTILTRDEHVRFLQDKSIHTAGVGRAIPGIELRIGDTAQKADDPVAELFVRSEQVGSLYKGVDGWYGTGDLATIDERGYVHLFGRVDRMINSGAYHIYPQEVEQAIQRAFGTVSVKVYGEPDEKWGEAVVARIVWRDEIQPPTLPEFRRILSKYVARYKVPHKLYSD